MGPLIENNRIVNPQNALATYASGHASTSSEPLRPRTTATITKSQINRTVRLSIGVFSEFYPSGLYPEYFEAVGARAHNLSWAGVRFVELVTGSG